MDSVCWATSNHCGHTEALGCSIYK